MAGAVGTAVVVGRPSHSPGGFGNRHNRAVVDACGGGSWIVSGKMWGEGLNLRLGVVVVVVMMMVCF